MAHLALTFFTGYIQRLMVYPLATRDTHRDVASQEKVDILSSDSGRHFERESSYEHEKVHRNTGNNHVRLPALREIAFCFLA